MQRNWWISTRKRPVTYCPHRRNASVTAASLIEDGVITIGTTGRGEGATVVALTGIVVVVVDIEGATVLVAPSTGVAEDVTIAAADMMIAALTVVVVVAMVEDIGLVAAVAIRVSGAVAMEVVVMVAVVAITKAGATREAGGIKATGGTKETWAVLLAIVGDMATGIRAVAAGAVSRTTGAATAVAMAAVQAGVGATTVATVATDRMGRTHEPCPRCCFQHSAARVTCAIHSL